MVASSPINSGLWGRARDYSQCNIGDRGGENWGEEAAQSEVGVRVVSSNRGRPSYSSINTRL